MQLLVLGWLVVKLGAMYAHSFALSVAQEVLLLKDEIVKCHEKLEKAPKQLALAEAVRRTFEQLTKDFHEECTLALHFARVDLHEELGALGARQLISGII